MFKRTLGIIAALAILGGTAVSAAADTEVAPPTPIAVVCDQPTFQIDQVTYNIASPYTVGLGNVKAIVTPTTSEGCEVKRWSYTLYGENGAVAQLKDYTSDYGVLTLRQAKLENRDAGDQKAKVTVTYGPADGYTGTVKRNRTYQVDADLLRRGTFGSTFKAPATVAVGSQATITAKLGRANWDTDKYGAYAGQNVTLQARDNVYGAWDKIITRKTDSKGVVTFKMNIEQDTQVRVFYFGNSTTSYAPSTALTIQAS